MKCENEIKNKHYIDILFDNVKLTPLLKYPGGKERELQFLIPFFPENINNYFEPFVGGGAIYFYISAKKYFINDKSSELISLYKYVKEQNISFFSKLEEINHNWKLIDEIVNRHSESLYDLFLKFNNYEISNSKIKDSLSSFVYKNSVEFNGMFSTNFNIEIEKFAHTLISCINNKFNRLSKLSKENIITKQNFVDVMTCAFKSAFYTHFRHIYNNALKLKISDEFKTALYLYFREFCYSSMFRYNSNGEFNVPYGGISYNSKNFDKKIKYYRSQELIEKLSKTTIESLDFADFLNKIPMKCNDFMFLDPPYDTAFSTYAQNDFNRNDQTRLRDYLYNKCNCNFLLDIKQTSFISSLYKDGDLLTNGRRIRIIKFDKKYQVSFQNRNDKEVEHLVIMNY